MLYIGPHVSAEGLMGLSVERAESYGATGFAIFTKNQKRWVSPPLKEADISSFKTNMESFGFPSKAVLPHAGYLINPASPDPEMREKSLTLFRDEAKRCLQLGLDVINIHPGAYKEGDRKDGVKRSADMINQVLSEYPTFHVAVENTAGAGTIIGSKFEELALLYSYISYQDRVGFTLDTAHMFGAGYDVKSDINKVLDEFFSILGKDRLYGMHLNDSKVPLASNKDRHDSLGMGLIGLEAFKQIVKRKEVQNIPLILETPDESRWKEEIRILKNASEENNQQ